MTKRYAERIAAGLCVDCGIVPAEEGRRRCPECAHKQVQATLARRDLLITAHRCTQCGKPLPGGYNGQRCRACQEKGNAAVSELRAKRISAGLCPKCGGVPEKGYRVCERCLANQKRYAIFGTSKQIRRQEV